MGVRRRRRSEGGSVLFFLFFLLGPVFLPPHSAVPSLVPSWAREGRGRMREIAGEGGLLRSVRGHGGGEWVYHTIPPEKI